MRVKSRGDQKGEIFLDATLARNRAMSPICCEITGQGVGMASRLTGRRDGGEKRGDVRKGEEEKKGSILFPAYLYFLCPFFLSSLVQLSLSLSLSMYIDAYIYVHPLRYFFVQFWLTRRLIPLKGIQYQHIHQLR